MNQVKPVINIALVDDHAMLCEAIAGLINANKKFKVIIQETSGRAFISAIEKSEIKPDICVMDVSMPEMNGYETLAIIKKKWPDIKALGLSIYTDTSPVLNMLRSGANGFVTKRSRSIILHAALEAIYKEGYYYSEEVTEDFFVKARTMEVPELTEKEKKFL